MNRPLLFYSSQSLVLVSGQLHLFSFEAAGSVAGSVETSIEVAAMTVSERDATAAVGLVYSFFIVSVFLQLRHVT